MRMPTRDELVEVLMRGPDLVAYFAAPGEAERAAARLNEGRPDAPYWARDFVPDDERDDPETDEA